MEIQYIWIALAVILLLLELVGDQYRIAQHQWLGDQGLMAGDPDLRTAGGSDCVGYVRTQAGDAGAA